MEIEEYQKFIEDLASSSSDRVFYNSGNECARIVFANLFKTAKENIRIFCGNLSNEVTNSKEYVDNLNLAINNGTTVQILVQFFSTDYLESSLFKRLSYLKNEEGKNVIIKKTSEKVYTKGPNEETSEVHFCTCDNKAYRVEYDIVNRKAQGSFNDEERTKKLTRIFDEIFNNSNSSEVEIRAVGA